MKMDAPFPEGMVEDIRRFFEKHRADPAGVTENRSDPFATGLFFPLQRKRELRRMMEVAWSIRPKTVMEIGADKGGGLYWWCLMPSVERVIACEIRGTPYAEEFERAFPHIKFLWLPLPSNMGVGLTTDFLGRETEIDVLFIDGDKARFLEDFDAYRPLVSDSGVVFMHDVHDEDRAMRRAWQAVRDRGYPAAEIIDTTESAEARIRELDGKPAANAHEGWLRQWQGRSCGVGVLWMREGLR